jgi:integrase
LVYLLAVFGCFLDFSRKKGNTNIRNAKPSAKVQKLSDGEGLYLHIAPTGGKLWRLAYRFDGKQKTLSFGKYPAVSLQDARKRRMEAKELLAANIDPGQKKKEVKAAAIAAKKEAENTFEAVAREWHGYYSPSLTPKHALKLMRYLEQFFFPAFGPVPIADVEPSHILGAIRPIEGKGKLNTSHRLANLASQVLGYAVITGRIKYNVAVGLSRALTPEKRENYPTLKEPKAIGRLLREIDEYQGFPSITFYLKILPYVFVRPSELRLAEWEEFNFDDVLWRIPTKRMKMRREHIIPLAPQVVALLHELRLFSGDGQYLFPSVRAKTTTLSDAGPLAALRRIGYTQDQMCLHGFRAMASTRLNEMGFRADVIEAQLAHKEPDGVRLAYNRAEYTEERKKLMRTWADYLDGLREKAKQGQ